MTQKTNFEKILGSDIDFIIPGFEKVHPKGVFRSLAFSEKDSCIWYNSVQNQLLEKIRKTYYPIYRIGDGEFILLLGHIVRKKRPKESVFTYLLKYIFFSIKYYWEWRLMGFQAQSRHAGYVSGGYNRREISQIQTKSVEQIRYIGTHGAIAPILSYRTDTLSFSQNFVPFKNWLSTHNIRFNKENYIPFYFIYALLLGPERAFFYKNKKILIVTSHTPEKKKHIQLGFENEGVSSIQFINISRNRSFYDEINLDKIKMPVDLVLVGAGLGASNILCQLRDTNTLCIDAGYIIEAIANPNLKKERTFCWPDNERDSNFKLD